MPITKSAIKKQRVDKSRALVNVVVRGRVKAAIKSVREKPDAKKIANFYSVIDRAVSKKLVAKRTAARLKARIVKFAKTKLSKSPFGK